ncbi:MAG: DNA-directed RNA polymerase subunit omega [Sulfurospirillaceae bacterium]|nr:DNA-directed RNA polymerase subunit omega [Sulfurospirillaceae bacterium]
MRTEQVIAEALKKVDSDRYLLSIMVAKRAEQLANGAQPLVKASMNKEKFTDIALREIADGKIILDSVIDLK